MRPVSLLLAATLRGGRLTPPGPRRLYPGHERPGHPPRAVRTLVLEESMRARVGHIGSALSIAEIAAVLFGETMRLPGTDDPSRDRFILPKGTRSSPCMRPSTWKTSSPARSCTRKRAKRWRPPREKTVGGDPVPARGTGPGWCRII